MKPTSQRNPSEEPLSGRTCVVTGATSGIGRATATELARLGAHVAICGRNVELGKAVLAEVQERARGGVELFLADLSSQSEVRRLAAELLERLPQIHVLINNAGVITQERTLTADGIETQLAVNHLAPFLLTNLLLDRLKASSPARIVNVASQVEGMGSIDFDDLGRERSYVPTAAYAQSKLANVLFTRELALRLRGTGVTANCLHPGVIATRLLDDYLRRPKALGFWTRMRSPPPTEGARTSVYLAASSEVQGVTGKYFVNCKAVPSSARSQDPALARRLWDVSAQLVGLEARR